MSHRHKVTMFAAMIATTAFALAGSTGPALAECVSQTNRFPDYADVAPTARTVVIGTVVETRPDEDRSEGRFRLRVDEVIRGDPPTAIQVEFLRSGLPRRGSSACRASAYLSARTGDVIALALDGRLDGRTHVNTATWIEGRPSEWDPGIRVMSRARAIAAAKGLPATDTMTGQVDAPHVEATHSFLAWVVLILRDAARDQGHEPDGTQRAL